MNDQNDLLYKFKEDLKVLNRSTATVNTYTLHVRLFLNANRHITPKAITRTHIEKYVAGLYDFRDENNKPYTVSTICTKIRSIKRFFNFLEKANIIFIDPAESIKEPQKDVQLRTVLTNQEVNTILAQPDLGTNKGIRERAILELFYSTGIRLNELCSLTIYDADLHERMLRINNGKGKKDRVVPFGKHAARFLREYITKVRPRYARKNKTSRYLFINRYGNPMTKQVVEIMVRYYAEAAEIKKHVTPHIFRHTFASTLIKNGAQIVAVQKMLGHSDLGSTQCYIRSLGLDIKKVHQKTHPREKDKKERHAIKPEIKRINSKWI